MQNRIEAFGESCESIFLFAAVDEAREIVQVVDEDLKTVSAQLRISCRTRCRGTGMENGSYAGVADPSAAYGSASTAAAGEAASSVDFATTATAARGIGSASSAGGADTTTRDGRERIASCSPAGRLGRYSPC